MTALRKTALVAGIFYLITFVSIPTLFLYGDLRTDRNFITSSGSSTGVLWGAFLEVIVALAGIGTAVTLFPVVKRQNEGMALGFANPTLRELVEMQYQFAEPFIVDSSKIATKLGVRATPTDHALADTLDTYRPKPKA